MSWPHFSAGLSSSSEPPPPPRVCVCVCVPSKERNVQTPLTNGPKLCRKNKRVGKHPWYREVEGQRSAERVLEDYLTTFLLKRTSVHQTLFTGKGGSKRAPKKEDGRAQNSFRKIRLRPALQRRNWLSKPDKGHEGCRGHASQGNKEYPHERTSEPRLKLGGS